VRKLNDARGNVGKTTMPERRPCEATRKEALIIRITKGEISATTMAAASLITDRRCGGRGGGRALIIVTIIVA
jgi:hypothetical protein